MVGRALSEHCRESGDEVFAYDHHALNIADADRVLLTVSGDQPEVLINCAAWTDVDGCELNRDRAFAVNASGPENLAQACRATNAALITISTDYVFDGTKEGFYTQRDQPAPESVYGLSKLEGERRAQLAHARTSVVRTGFIFGPGGTNFLSTIIDRARRGLHLSAIRDAAGTPTYAVDLATRLRELAQLDLPGIYHCVNSGNGASYEEFTRAALEIGGFGSVNVTSVDMASLNRPAPRPANSRLKCLLSEAIGLVAMPLWRDSLASFVRDQVQGQAAGKP